MRNNVGGGRTSRHELLKGEEAMRMQDVGV